MSFSYASRFFGVDIGDVELLVPGRHGQTVKFAVRPENLRLVPSDSPHEEKNTAALPVEVVRTIDLGAYVRLELDGAVPLVAHMSPSAFSELTSTQASGYLALIRPKAVHILPADE